MKTLKAALSLFVVLSSLIYVGIYTGTYAGADTQQGLAPAPPDQGGDLAAELARVTALKNGVHPENSTGTRGGGNLAFVDMKSLEDLMISGKLNQLVRDAAAKVDPAKSYFSNSASDWQMMLSGGMLDDITQTPYTFSETANCRFKSPGLLGPSTHYFESRQHGYVSDPWNSSGSPSLRIWFR
jgi:hypothetical protein